MHNTTISNIIKTTHNNQPWTLTWCHWYCSVVPPPLIKHQRAPSYIVLIPYTILHIMQYGVVLTCNNKTGCQSKIQQSTMLFCEPYNIQHTMKTTQHHSSTIWQHNTHTKVNNMTKQYSGCKILLISVPATILMFCDVIIYIQDTQSKIICNHMKWNIVCYSSHSHYTAT